MFASQLPCLQSIVFLKRTSSSHIEIRISWMDLPCVLKELKTGNGTLGVVEGLASSAPACREYSPALPIPEQQQGSRWKGGDWWQKVRFVKQVSDEMIWGFALVMKPCLDERQACINYPLDGRHFWGCWKMWIINGQSRTILTLHIA